MSEPLDWPIPHVSESVATARPATTDAQRPIVVTFDGGYVRAAAATLRSLARVRAGKQTTVIALVGDVSANQRRALSTMGSALGLILELRDVSSCCGGLPYDSHGSPAVYYRLLMGEMLPEFSSVLYVHSDTIFLGDPADLLCLDFHPYPIAAVQDLCVPTLGSPDCLPGYDLTHAERELPYFNSVTGIGWTDAGTSFRYTRSGRLTRSHTWVRSMCRLRG